MSQILSLSGRRALVTSAVSGIGFAIAQNFAACGAYVVLDDLPGGRLDQVARDLGGTAIGADLSIRERAYYGATL